MAIVAVAGYTRPQTRVARSQDEAGAVSRGSAGLFLRMRKPPAAGGLPNQHAGGPCVMKTPDHGATRAGWVEGNHVGRPMPTNGHHQASVARIVYRPVRAPTLRIIPPAWRRQTPPACCWWEAAQYAGGTARNSRYKHGSHCSQAGWAVEVARRLSLPRSCRSRRPRRAGQTTLVQGQCQKIQKAPGRLAAATIAVVRSGPIVRAWPG
jgi:hypothetical protein